MIMRINAAQINFSADKDSAFTFQNNKLTIKRNTTFSWNNNTVVEKKLM